MRRATGLWHAFGVEIEENEAGLAFLEAEKFERPGDDGRVF